MLLCKINSSARVSSRIGRQFYKQKKAKMLTVTTLELALTLELTSSFFKKLFLVFFIQDDKHFSHLTSKKS